MKRSLLNLSMLLIASISTLFASAQANLCTQPASAIPDFSGTVVQVNPTNYCQSVTNDNNYSIGEVFCYQNVVTTPAPLDAYITIEAISNARIVNFDNNSATAPSIPSRFQPQIGPLPQNMTADLEGYVQYSIQFRAHFSRNASGNVSPCPVGGQSAFTLQNLSSGLRFRHYDLDGAVRGTTGYFRETGWATGQASVYFNSPTNLTDAGLVTDGGYTWRKILGQTLEHDGVSSDPDVLYTSVYTGVNTVRFRMGFQFVRGNGGAYNLSYREYAAEFGCFDLGSNIPLPVKLVSFGGSYRNQQALLQWSTQSETNFEKFEIERSTNGTDFATVGIALPYGAANATAKYQFPDQLSQVNGNVFYYRLKMVDADGGYTYSQVISIKRDNKIINGISITPNPVVNGAVSLRMTAIKNSTVEIRVIDLTGKVVLSQQNSIATGNNTISVNNIQRLTPGIYSMQLINDQEIITSKFSVIR